MTPENNYALRTDEKREIWSMKISPRLKYLAGIAARAHEKTLSNYVETSLAASFESIRITDDQESYDGKTIPGKTLAELADKLYAGSEADRFIAMLNIAPWLVSDEESRLRRVLEHSDHYYPQLSKGNHVWQSEHIREDWPLLAAIRDGEANIDILPRGKRPNAALAFGLKSEKERVALYKNDPTKYKRESEAYSKAMKGGK
jgi:hypothetical protein